MQIIKKYFPDINYQQEKQFSQLQELYNHWNTQINVISRRSMNELYTEHVLHSLAIAKIIDFKARTKVLDFGTGGGFPGIPLAILFPNVDFLLVDSIAKKIRVVSEVKKELKLNNVRILQERAENIKETFDFVLSRGVTKMPTFKKWVKNKFNRVHNNTLNNGILYLKGGDLTEELKGIKYRNYKISDFFYESFFESKKLVYIGFPHDF